MQTVEVIRDSVIGRMVRANSSLQLVKSKDGVWRYPQTINHGEDLRRAEQHAKFSGAAYEPPEHFNCRSHSGRVFGAVLDEADSDGYVNVAFDFGAIEREVFCAYRDPVTDQFFGYEKQARSSAQQGVKKLCN
jgi:hypothetical protein